MLEKLDFFTPTLVTVLQLFLTDPMQEHHERDVMRRTGVSKGSANKILRLLAEKGFLIRERKGRMVFYRLDTGDPAVRQFKVLVNVYALTGLIDRIKERCRRIILFGSCAEGTDVRGSDIDLFVLTSEKGPVRGEIGRFNAGSERRVAPIVVDANEFVEMREEDKPLYENVERGIVLWERE